MGKLLPREDLAAHKSLTLEITGEELEKKKEEIAKIFQKTRKIPGFRPGRAPLKLVMNRYGRQIEAEAVEELAYNKVMDEIDKNMYDYIRRTLKLKYTKNDDGSYYVEAEFDVIPQFSFPDLSRIKVEKRIRRITRADVEEELEKIRMRHGKFKELDKSADEGDYIIYDFEEIDTGSGKVVHRAKEVFVKLEWGKIDATVYEHLKGARKGDVIEIDRKLSIEGGEKLPVKQVFKIRAVATLELPELNDEFAKQYGYESLEDLKKAIEESLRKEAEKQSENNFRAELFNKIHEMIGFELPESLVEQEVESIMKNYNFHMPADEQRTVAEVVAKERIKEDIILFRFAQQNDIKITDEEVIEYIKEHLKDKSKLDEVVEKYRKENRFETIRRHLKYDRAYDMLKNLVKMEVVIE